MAFLLLLALHLSPLFQRLCRKLVRKGFRAGLDHERTTLVHYEINCLAVRPEHVEGERRIATSLQED